MLKKRGGGYSHEAARTPFTLLIYLGAALG